MDMEQSYEHELNYQNDVIQDLNHKLKKDDEQMKFQLEVIDKLKKEKIMMQEVKDIQGSFRDSIRRKESQFENQIEFERVRYN